MFDGISTKRVCDRRAGLDRIDKVGEIKTSWGSGSILKFEEEVPSLLILMDAALKELPWLPFVGSA